jgi:ribonuclease BN (tRNA processing enzyme)
MMDKATLKIEIQNAEENLRLLRQELEKKTKKLDEYRQQAIENSQNLDAWVDSFVPSFQEPNLGEGFSLLFLGACSGEWAARTRYRGDLPGFGGFLLLAEGKRILVDPGQGTFSSLISDSVRIHPSFLDDVIVTHVHRDCVHDLELIVIAACLRGIETSEKPKSCLNLWAEKTVLFGHPIDKSFMLQKLSPIENYKYSKSCKEILKKDLEKFSHEVPGTLNLYDLFSRLEGRFTQIEIDKCYDLHPNIKLYTRRSYHRVTFGQLQIPALDFVFLHGEIPSKRCVYLSDTEYCPQICESYKGTLEELRPIDILICNVKTLDVDPYPEGHDQEGFTKRHLGWKGLLQLTKDFQEAGLLLESSLVVLRAWGIETVTTLDRHDKALVATPGKLAVYLEEFKEKTGQDALIPGTTLIKCSSTNRGKTDFIHMTPPFFEQGSYGRFGEIFYSSEKMAELIIEAKALTDNSATVVLITGETGVGKDTLARSIHVQSGRSGKYVVENAANLVSGLSTDQLFGNDGKAFTGAMERPGLFLEAANGTLCIEEVGDMEEKFQVQILSPLENRIFTRLGDHKQFNLTCQVIFTTDRDLKKAIVSGAFREQLYQRLRILTIPPLRDRPGDISAILQGWGNPLHQVEGLLDILQHYSWPGNVRQLKRVEEELKRKGDWSRNHVNQILEKEAANFPSAVISQDPSHVSIDLNELDEEILGLLKHGKKMTRKELENSVKAPKSTVISHIGKLGKLRLIKKRGRGPLIQYELIS